MPVSGGFEVILRELHGYTFIGEQIKEFCFFRKTKVSRTYCV